MRIVPGEARAARISKRVSCAPHLRVDAAQRDALVEILGADRLDIRPGERRVHADQHLARLHRLALMHQDLLDDPLLGRLHDLQIARRHQLAVGHGDDVEPPEHEPQQQPGEQRQQQAQHPARERGRRPVLDAQQRRREIGRVRGQP